MKFVASPLRHFSENSGYPTSEALLIKNKRSIIKRKKNKQFLFITFLKIRGQKWRLMIPLFLKKHQSSLWFVTSGVFAHLTDPYWCNVIVEEVYKTISVFSFGYRVSLWAIYSPMKQYLFPDFISFTLEYVPIWRNKGFQNVLLLIHFISISDILQYNSMNHALVVKNNVKHFKRWSKFHRLTILLFIGVQQTYYYALTFFSQLLIEQTNNTGMRYFFFQSEVIFSLKCCTINWGSHYHTSPWGLCPGDNTFGMRRYIYDIYT